MGIGNIVSNPIGATQQYGPWAAAPGTTGTMAMFGDPLGLGFENPFAMPQQPGAPNWEQMAREQYEASLQAARPTQITPFGSSVWTQGPEGQWTQETTLSPERQAMLQAGQARQAEMLGAPMPTYGAQRGQVMEAMMGRVTGDIERARTQKESQLRAQGIPRGSEAYAAEMAQIDRQETDARQQAEIAAAQMAGQEYQSALAGRGQQLGETLALTPGMPQMPSFQQVPGPDLMGAAAQQGQWDLAGYNAEVARQNALMQGLFSLGGAAIGAG